MKPWKLVFGVPFYGYEWTNVPNIDDGLFEPGSPLGQGSAYNFIVTIESQFQKRRDSITYEPWLYDGTNFWTYGDPVTIKFKMGYFRRRHLASVMVWELSNDVYDGRLLNTIASSLKRKDEDDE